MIVGSLQIPVIGPINASLENSIVLRKIMGGGYHDPRKLPQDLVTEFDRVAHRPGYRTMAGKVLSGWRSWAKARDRYASIGAPVTLIYGDDDWSRIPERERTRDLIRGARLIKLRDTGHFSAVESPHEVAKIILCILGVSTAFAQLCACAKCTVVTGHRNVGAAVIGRREQDVQFIDLVTACTDQRSFHIPPPCGGFSTTSVSMMADSEQGVSLFVMAAVLTRLPASICRLGSARVAPGAIGTAVICRPSAA